MIHKLFAVFPPKFNRRKWNFVAEISVEGSITHNKSGWEDYHLIAINYSKLKNYRVIEVTLLFCINFGIGWLVTPKPAKS